MFSFRERTKLIQKLSDQTFDLVIIGGGITGAGVALQAAASGLSVALVEMLKEPLRDQLNWSMAGFGISRHLMSKSFQIRWVNERLFKKSLRIFLKQIQ